MATFQELPSGNFPNDQFPKPQLPKSVLAAALGPQPVLTATLGPLAHPSRLGGKLHIWEIVAWD